MNPDKLYYFSKSSDKPPGKGVNEYVENVNKYKELSKVKNWRKMLSNFYISPFKLDGEIFGSVEHYYQGNKFFFNNKNFYKKFTWNSNSIFSRDSNIAKSVGGTSGKYKGKLIRPSNVKIDPNFFDYQHKIFNVHLLKFSEIILIKSMFSKFTQNKELMNVLLNTGEAQLWHGTRGVKPARIYTLEKVRNCIRKFKNYDLSLIDLSNY
jgi:predicted NAD-dependent protein-ADP-ribosyltransferase YbiA (DUF1768 family)